MPRIFLSYRRKDSTAITRQIGEVLAGRFGNESVFLDLHSIPPGAEFRPYISRKLEAADILLTVIGSDWLERDAGGRPRLLDSRDLVRVEIEVALERGIRVVPILVGSARLPNRSELPDSLAPLLDCNAAHVDDGRDFRMHAERLADDLDRLLDTSIDRQTPLHQTGPIATRELEGDVRPAVRPKGILLDRHYSYLLTTYCASGARDGSAKSEYQGLFDVLTYCLLFFDELVIEQPYVSSIAWSLDQRESEAFARLFRSFSFDLLPMDTETRLLLSETIEADLADAAYMNVVKRYYEDRPLQGANHRDLVTYVARCLFAAESQNWCLLPWTKRVTLFEHKLRKATRFASADTVVGLVQGAVEIVVPELKSKSLEELADLRADPRIEDFRRMIWELSGRYFGDDCASSTEALVLDEFRTANRQLLGRFNGGAKTIRVGHSGASPLPVNASVDLPDDFERQLDERRFNWLLFLMEGADGH